MTLDGFPKPQSESKEREFGANVQMTVKMMRHGQRTPQGALTEAGREDTRERAQASGLKGEDFDAVKAYGSSVGERKGVGKRAFETAETYATEIAGDDALNTRVNDLMSYEKIMAPVPYDHDVIIESHLPQDYASLSEEGQSAAMAEAQSAAAQEELSMTTPEAIAYRKESASLHAHALNHYRMMVKRLKSGSKVLIPLGTHGTMVEYLLMEALVHKGENGEDIVGTNSVEDFGGEFGTSDSYTLHVDTDEQGNEKALRLTLDQGEKAGQEFTLDLQKLDELDEEYKRLYNK